MDSHQPHDSQSHSHKRGKKKIVFIAGRVFSPGPRCHSYRFFLFSFLPLAVVLVSEERAVACPVVFRWSNSLFLVGNSN